MDTAGNIENANTLGIDIDATPPTISIGASSAATTGSGPITYTVTYSDLNFNASTLTAANVTLNATGTAAGTVSVSGTGNTRTVTVSDITGNGTLGISIASGTASDLAGNLAPASAASDTFQVSNVVVSVGSVVIAEANVTKRDGILESNEPLVITWAATSPNGVVAQTLTIDGRVMTPIYGPYGGLYFACPIGTWAAGNHTYTILSNDSKGISSSSTGTFTVVAATVAGPTIGSVVIVEDDVTKRDGVLASNDSLVITWAATSPNGIASQTLTIDGRAMTPIYGPYGGRNFACPIGTWPAGSHTYTILSTDSKGISSSATGTFTVVAATVAGPTIGSVVIVEDNVTKRDGVLASNDSLVITWAATSPNGIASQTLTIDGRAMTPIYGPYGGRNFACPIGTWPAGSHTYTIFSTDSKGISSSATSTFTVVAATVAGPTIGSVVIVEDDVTKRDGVLASNDALVITWAATSPNGIASQTLTIDGRAMTPIYGPYGGRNFACVIGTWPAGNHAYTILSTDSRGISSSSSGTFAVAAPLLVAPPRRRRARPTCSATPNSPRLPPRRSIAWKCSWVAESKRRWPA